MKKNELMMAIFNLKINTINKLVSLQRTMHLLCVRNMLVYEVEIKEVQTPRLIVTFSGH